jgi:hypothetical protein
LVNNTGGKFVADVNNTRWQIATIINNTKGKFAAGEQYHAAYTLM